MDNEREIKHFNKLAEKKGYAWWGSKTYSGKFRKKVRAELAKSYLGNFCGKNILEIGCADGSYSLYLKETFKENNLISTDISHNQINLAISRVKGEFQVDNAEKMSFKDETIDYIIGNSILHHLNLDKCMEECLRVLKPKGKFFFTEPNMLNPEVFIQKQFYWVGKYLGNSPDETAFYRWSLKSKLLEKGFSNVIVKNFDFLHPLIPKKFTKIINQISRGIEKIPLIKEISGSLIIYGEK